MTTTTLTSQPTAYTYLHLTATFTPPAGCLAQTYTAPSDIVSFAHTGSYATLGITRALTTSCFPSSFLLLGQTFAGSDAGGTTLVVSSYYLPGVCPLGYSAVTENIQQQSLIVTTCCPSANSPLAGYVYGSTCYQSINKVLNLAIGVNPTTQSNTSLLVSFATPISFINTSSITIFNYILGTGVPEGIYVNVADEPIYVANVIPTVASTPASASVSVTSESPLSVASTSNAPLSVASSSGVSTTASSLSSGAKIGIGIGAGIGVLALLLMLVAFLLWRRRARKLAIASTVTTPDTPYGFEKAELPGDSKTMHELPHGILIEADGAGQKALNSDSVAPVELDGGWRGWEAPTPTIPQEDHQA